MRTRDRVFLIICIGIVALMALLALTSHLSLGDFLGITGLFLGIVLTIWGLAVLIDWSARRSKAAAQEKLRKDLTRAFEKSAWPVTEENIRNRPLGETTGKLVGGALIVGVTTFLGGMIPVGGQGAIVLSLIGCGVGLWIVRETLFASAHPVDLRRWEHFWRGEVLGYWVSYLPIACLLISGVSSRQIVVRSQSEAFNLDLMAFVIAMLIGLGVGFLNVNRTDAAEKQALVDFHRQRSGVSPQTDSLQSRLD